MLDLSTVRSETSAIVLPIFAPSRVERPRARGLGGFPVKQVAYVRDEEIYGEGDYNVRCGAVRTFTALRDGRRQIDAFHLPGEFFGLGGGETHVLSAEAVVDSKVAIVKRRVLETSAANDAETACAMWRMASDELCNAQEHMLLLGRKSAMERVVAFLLDMDRRRARFRHLPTNGL